MAAFLVRTWMTQSVSIMTAAPIAPASSSDGSVMGGL
jgi:hypothetical protein